MRLKIQSLISLLFLNLILEAVNLMVNGMMVYLELIKNKLIGMVLMLLGNSGIFINSNWKSGNLKSKTGYQNLLLYQI
jgi:hypothetical protein